MSGQLPTAFDPVPLPRYGGGRVSPAELADAVAAWASSPPIRALVEACGWEWPPADDPAGLLAQLEAYSQAWDYRQGGERYAIVSGGVVVDGHTVPDELALGAAEALGLVTGDRPTGRVTHVAVLSGQLKACVNRCRLAASLLADGLTASEIVVLSAHRPLGPQEVTAAADLGWDAVADEADAAVAAARDTWSLGPAGHEDGTEAIVLPPRPGDDSADAEHDAYGAALARFHAGWALRRWSGTPDHLPVEALTAPSPDPAARRANTADQLRWWADRTHVGPDDTVLLVTTQIYVPYQHGEGIRVLGLERGCTVLTCGVDAGSAALPIRRFGPTDYLQEVRSALRGAVALYDAARSKAVGPPRTEVTS